MIKEIRKDLALYEEESVIYIKFLLFQIGGIEERRECINERN
jgi:hypothetical protein